MDCEVVLVSSLKDEVPLEGSLRQGQVCGRECLERHESCISILHGDWERWVKVGFGGIDLVHAAEVVGEDISFTLYMLELEAIGLQV
jgi:hypothetical protein